MTDSFLTGFFKKPRTGTTPRLHPTSDAEMGSRATLPSTVNLRVPAERRSVPAEEGRGAVVSPQGLQPKLERAAYQEKSISIKYQEDIHPGDPSHSPLNPSAKGKEKQLEGLGKTSGGKHIQSLHEQPLNTGKNVIQGKCSKPAASPFGIPPASSSELPDDHPLKQEEGSLLYLSFLVVTAHGTILIDQLADYLDTRCPKKMFPDNWWNDLENQLMSNRHFLKRKGLFTICEDLGQPPCKEIVNKKMEPSVVSRGQDKNFAKRSYGISTESKVQERTPPLNFAVRTPCLPEPSDEDIDWTPSVEKLERPAQRGGRRGPSSSLQSHDQRASEPEERNSSSSALRVPIATQECAKINGIWRCTSDAVQGELYCDRHMEQ